jgi:2-polyprenyl-6-methoxyphenol hydroxylase-like FAD-dependent oxidoreductase
VGMAELERVVVVGGGVGGLTVALALKRAGVAVEVHEKYPQLAGRATGFTLWSYAIKHLQDLGLDDPTRIGSPIAVTEIHNQKGDLIEEMPVGEVSAKLGAPSCDVNRRDLQRVAIELLGDGIVHMGSECVDVELDGDTATAVLADGSRAEGSLVIGADGAHSITRVKIAPDAKVKYSGFGGWGGVLDRFEHELMKPHRHVEVWARGSKGGVADVGNGAVRWYVTRHAAAGAEGPVDKAEILEHIDGWYELLRAAVEAADPASIVTTEAWDMDPIERWFDRRLVLLGDSAHLTTPFASMGACMTIDDAVNLVAHLTSASTVEEALSAYQDDRKKRDEDTVEEARKMGKLQQIHSPLVSWLRDEAFEHAPPDKMRQVAEEMAKGE